MGWGLGRGDYAIAAFFVGWIVLVLRWPAAAGVAFAAFMAVGAAWATGLLLWRLAKGIWGLRYEDARKPWEPFKPPDY